VQIERFEDIKAWQGARVLVKIIYDAIKSNKNFTGDYKFREQRTGSRNPNDSKNSTN